MMKRTLGWLMLMAGILSMSSCIKDEEANKECDIQKAWIEGDEFKKYFTDANQMRKDNVSSSESEIVFTVRSLISLPKQLPLFLEVTPKATVEPASGTPQDFTQGPVVYTVTSEDGQWKRQYTVKFQEASLPVFKFGFEHVANSEKTTGGSIYNEFYEVDSKGERLNIWASGNAGASLTLVYKQPDAFPTYSVSEGHTGKALCLQTISAGEFGVALKKPIAAGTLFLGKFIVENVITNTLKTTRFGIPIDREPVRVTGWYKYKPGEKFTNKDMQETAGKVDQAHIYGVLYKNKDAEGKELYLYGDDVLTNASIVKKAEVAALPATDEWTRFEMFFEGQDIDPTMLKNRDYNLTIVFSSSKDGASFEGAIGSVLLVDDVEVSFLEVQ